MIIARWISFQPNTPKAGVHMVLDWAKTIFAGGNKIEARTALQSSKYVHISLKIRDCVLPSTFCNRNALLDIRLREIVATELAQLEALIVQKLEVLAAPKGMWYGKIT